MSSVIKIIKGTTEVSLLDASGFNLQMRGWDMAPAEREAGVVRERIKCKLTATDPDDAASQLQALNDLLEDATLYSKNDQVQITPVYIETQYEDETNKRYAMIAGDYARFKVSPFDYIAKTHDVFRSIDLVITREHPWGSHKPGILPGRIQLDETDGPAFDYGETDFDVELLSTFGHIPTTATGGIIGRPGQFGGGVQLAEADTNLVTNPSFETNTAGWATLGTNTIATSTDQAKYDSKSMKCTYQDNGYPCYYVITITAAVHSASIQVYIPSDYDGTDLRVEFAGFDGSTGTDFVAVNLSLTDQWQLVTVPNLLIDAGDLVGHLGLRELGTPTAGKFIYVDAALVHTGAYILPYWDGSLGPGHAWTGAVHGSTSTRTLAKLGYVDTDIVDVAEGTLSFWEYRETSFDFGGFFGSGANQEFDMYCWDGAGGRFRFNAVELDFSGAAGQAPAGQWNHFVCTWDSSNLKLYIDGALIVTQTRVGDPTLGGTLYVGAFVQGTLPLNGIIDDFFILDRAMSADEISDLYDSGKAFTGDPNLKFYLPFDGPQQLHIANFRDDIAITEIYNKIDGGAWSANFATSYEWTLFPNAVAQDDFVLFGSTDQPLKHIVLNLRTAGDLTDTALVLEYYNTDPAWIDLVLNEDYAVYPGTTLKGALESTGNVVISILPPSDCNKADPGTGTSAYCYRIRETDATPVYATHPVHAGQLAYAARTNELRIPSASLHGDAPPKVLLRLHADGGGDADPGFARLSRIVWGIKSNGLDGFTSNLNAGNQDNPSGWAVTYNIADTTSSADPSGPGGYSAGCTFATSEDLVVRLTFTGTNKAQYWLGNYRVYAICRQTGGATGETALRLRTFLGGVNDYDPHVDSATVPLVGVGVGFEALDMGELNIPFGPYKSTDNFSSVDLIIQVFAQRTAGAGTLRIQSLVLIPINQASSTINDTVGVVPGSGFALVGNQAIDHDGGVVGRGTNKIVISGTDYHSVMGWDSGGAFIEIDHLDVASRIYFLLLHYPLAGSWGTGPMIASPGCHLVGELQLNHSYRLLRGND